MKYTELRPIIRTDKMDETIEFYTTVLGFTCTEKNDDWGWANLRKDGVEIMLGKPDEHSPFDKPLFTGSFYINTDNADAVWEMLKDKVKVCYEPETFDWGMKEFGIYDNNGYLIQFGENIEGR